MTAASSAKRLTALSFCKRKHNLRKERHISKNILTLYSQRINIKKIICQTKCSHIVVEKGNQVRVLSDPVTVFRERFVKRPLYCHIQMRRIL